MIGLVTHLPGSGEIQTGDENPTQDPEDSGQNEHVDAEPLMQQFHFLSDSGHSANTVR